MDGFMEAALAEACGSVERGGRPIGSVIVAGSEIVGRGRNRQLQGGDVTSHAGIEAMRDAAARAGDAEDATIRGTTLYTTMTPCPMCAGAIIRFEVARVVIGEARTYTDFGTAPLMERQGIAVEILDDDACAALVEAWMARNPEAAVRMRSPDRPRLKL